MSLSKAQILSYCSYLALDLEDDTTISAYFDDVVNRLAFTKKPPFQKAALVELTAATATYNYETDMHRALFMEHVDIELFPTSESSLNAYGRDWRTDSGVPKAFITEQLTRQYTLWPNPDATSGTTVGLTEPYGEDYPDDILFLLYADARATAIAEIYELPLSLLILSREFSYDNQHQDIEFADICSQAANVFMQILEK